MQEYQNILDFWFLPKNHPSFGSKRMEWFKKDPDFDASIRQNFESIFAQAENGDLLHWADSKDGSLALILLFDQFSRNMFRDTARAFATDGKGREIAHHMISQGFFDALPDFQKTFAALPFEHSEDLEDQELAVRLFKNFGDDEAILYAVRHQDIIKEFGRFPHRNESLNRQSTKEEIEFLKQPNSSF